MATLAPRWYVRGPNDSHRYDYEVTVPAALRGQSFCKTCHVIHESPIGQSWHIESSDVDTMLCGVVIDLDEGEVRLRQPKSVCPRCTKRAGKEDKL